MKAVVVHSGGMDSSLCLAIAVKEFGADQVLSLSFSYGQRHSNELEAAKIIASHFGVKNKVLNINCLEKITSSALLEKSEKIEIIDGVPNSLVVGRNGLMARVASIHADSLGAVCIYMGVIEVEEANSGYRDCSRRYMDIIEQAIRLDLDKKNFEIRTPVVKMTKSETMKLGDELGCLDFLLKETITCYNGIKGQGCGECPAGELRAEGVNQFLNS